MQTGVLALVGVAVLFLAWVLDFLLPVGGVIIWAVVAVGLGLITAAALWDFRRVRGALSSRRGVFGIGTSVSLSLVVGIVVLANLVSTSLFHRFDLTGLAQFTLTTQTKEVLADLNSEVEVVSFYGQPNLNVENSAQIHAVNEFGFELLGEYENLTGLVDVRREDPELRPDLARQYGINPYGAVVGTVVFRGDQGQILVYGPQIQNEAESAFTSAILQVTGTRQRVVYFVTGHGEPTVLGEYESARRGLRDNLFHVLELDLRIAPEIPRDASVVVLAGPTEPLSSREIDLLDRYLREGGHLALLLDPDPQPELRELASKWWLSIDDGIVVDPASHVAPNIEIPLVDRSRNAYGLLESYFPGATAIVPLSDAPEWVELEPIAVTSPGSWLERSGLGASAPVLDDEDDSGPLSLAASMRTEAEEGEGIVRRSDSTRLLVVGDSDFASNRHFRNGNNSSMFLTMVNWLGAGEEIISVDRKVLPVRRLVLTPEEANFLNVSSVALLPLLLLVAAAIVWWRRR